MDPFWGRLVSIVLRPRRVLREIRESPRPWPALLWVLVPVLLGGFVASWAGARRWFDPYYFGMWGTLILGAWLAALALTALVVRLFRGHLDPDALVEASGLSTTPVLVGLLLLLPVLLRTEGRNFVKLDQVPFLGVMAGVLLWSAVLGFLYLRETAGLSTRRAAAAYVVFYFLSAAVQGSLVRVYVWMH